MDRSFAIFDLDGTLLDSMPFWNALPRNYLEAKGIGSLPWDLPEIVAPMTLGESARYFVEQLGVPGTPEQVEGELTAVLGELYRTRIPLKPGVRDYLEVLHRRGVRMCVASATASSLAEACLRRLGVRDHFAFLLSCDQVGAGKSRPDIFLEAARRLGATPQETAVYEDALHAARTARQAGFQVIGVRDAGAGEEWLRLQALADETISDWALSARREASAPPGVLQS